MSAKTKDNPMEKTRKIFDSTSRWGSVLYDLFMSLDDSRSAYKSVDEARKYKGYGARKLYYTLSASAKQYRNPENFRALVEGRMKENQRFVEEIETKYRTELRERFAKGDYTEVPYPDKDANEAKGAALLCATVLGFLDS